MPVLHNAGLLVTCRLQDSQSRLESISGGSMAWTGSRIEWVGPETELPERFSRETTVDARGMMVVPGLIDCHTHLAFGGWRASEFVKRSLGASYLEISRQGGGIRSTVSATRQESVEKLLHRCEGFLKGMACLGTAGVECKSGYGLDLFHEVRILELYRRLAQLQPLRLFPTLLAAHTVPPEYAGRKSDYVDLVCGEIIPAVAERGLAEFCDVFVEEGAFSVSEARRIQREASRFGLRPRLHVDQLASGEGAELAAELGSCSADHLEHVSENGLSRLAAAGVTAVILPLASLYLQQTPAPGRRMIDAGVGVAVATDFNPGSAPSFHLPLAMTLACIQSGLTPAESLMGATWFAAKSLGRQSEIGSLERGKSADFCLIDAVDPDHWLYHFRPNACAGLWVKGEPVLAAGEELKGGNPATSHSVVFAPTAVPGGDEGAERG